ncbi:TPA: SPOR domain-containing protein, partial [Neisseria meningitidis]
MPPKAGNRNIKKYTLFQHGAASVRIRPDSAARQTAARAGGVSNIEEILMKWLFTLLAVLNIAVFGGTVGYKLAVKAAGGVPENRTVENTPLATP